jgi:DNA uptake protein ComE-like DNA-binding protein
VSLAPLGLGTWAPIYAGVRAQRRLWWVLGAVWSVIALAGWVAAVASNGGTAAGLLIILGWTGAAATSFAIRSAYKQVMPSPFDAAVQRARVRLADRDQARRLARERPALAREIGVGRPDLRNAHDAGLVDVNNAPARVLASLPGVDNALATQITKARDGTDGFSSVEDLGAALDLDPNLVEDLRDRVVFLPR